MKKQDITVIGAAFFAVLYLINPTAGFIELIPDNIPLIGNLDEAGAVFILIAALKYFGFEMPSIFKKDNEKKDSDTKPTIIINK
ncbi:MAG TPA: DUF1232 domain-containing protein [Chitinophagales bacterium]|nr:DUF1232 domain-containing protein [Chitinophagales bacterium]HMW12580.1 DUF1232 domain-containing protein [Chitinophagales bacterium]HMX59844.1 DUF1232 domain-containing protein [Chitinophagales bacterium]HMY22869.1 DUF1232 domain-containing protein [Chitinophagales bacterium]HMZ33469.1 DUF1232 domain-containing protein [Chitinophagales bacterium]